MTGIYKITSPSGKVYIGQSINVQKRINGYLKLRSCVKQTALINSFMKYGVENHNFEVKETCLMSELNEKERFWQEYYNVLGNKGLNCFLTKTNDKSGVASEETKKRSSIAKKGQRAGENHHYFGKKRTDEVKKKISVNLKGRFRGEKSPNFGVKKSIEHINKISLARKGKTGSQTGMSKVVLNVETGIYYESLSLAVIAHGLNYDNTKHQVNGRLKNRTSLIYA